MRHALPVLLLLAGCARPVVDLPGSVQALIGAREDQVIGTLGVPNRTYEVGPVSVMGFDVERISGDPDAPPIRTIPADAVTVPACELTFSFREDGFPIRVRRVESYAYTGTGCR